MFVAAFDPIFFNNLKIFHFPKSQMMEQNEEDEDAAEAEDEDEDDNEDDNDIVKVGNIADNDKIVCI